mmetsp:Transcript_14800/g.30007  ORF Transcript_14800/g.30007 Transcript_14800/m.30007 type:complete len:217 (+) Transcript_14800:1327-1977(+)
MRSSSDTPWLRRWSFRLLRRGKTRLHSVPSSSRCLQRQMVLAISSAAVGFRAVSRVFPRSSSRAAISRLVMPPPVASPPMPRPGPMPPTSFRMVDESFWGPCPPCPPCPPGGVIVKVNAKADSPRLAGRAFEGEAPALPTRPAPLPPSPLMYWLADAAAADDDSDDPKRSVSWVPSGLALAEGFRRRAFPTSGGGSKSMSVVGSRVVFMPRSIDSL